MNSPLKQLPSLLDAEDRRAFLLFMAISFFAGLIEVVGVGSIMPFIGVLMQPDLITSNRWLAAVYHGLHFTEPRSFTILLGCATLITILIGGLVNIFNVHYQLKVTYRLGHKLAVRLFATYLHQPYSYFLEANSNGMKSAILTEVDRVVMTVLVPICVLLSKLMVVGIILLLLLLVNPLVTFLLIAVTSGVYSGLLVYFRHRMKRRGQEAVVQNKIRFQTTSEAFSSIRDIKLHNNASFFTAKFSDASSRYSDVMVYSLYHGQVPKFMIEMTGFVLIIALTLYLITHGTNTAADVIPLIALFAASGYKILPAAHNIYAALSNIRFNAASLWVVMQGMKLPVEQDSPGQSQTILPFNNDIVVRDVMFSYNKKMVPVLRGIHCRIEKHSLVGIVGQTGAGKSTLIDILIGLLTPDEGEILIDGQQLTPQTIKSWQRQIGYVPQKIYLVEDSIENNIAFGSDAGTANIARITRAAKNAQIDSFIESLPDKYQNSVGENGDHLSGGQRQRIGIARALYRDPSVLVLDEPTSALDSATANTLFQTLKTLSQQKTVIIITHSSEILDFCDQVLVIADGQIQVRKAARSPPVEHQ